jgi:catechol 2,3-dioxygenase-like lactoylglutathione lyase family enzyme
MLSYVDRVQLVVPDRKVAVERWNVIFGAEQVSEDGSKFLNAHRTTVQAGRSLFEFLEPAGPGPVQDFRERWGQGLYGAGFSTPDLGAMGRRLEAAGVPVVDEKGCLYLGETRFGMPTVIVQDQPREYVGHIRCVYEVTNPVGYWEAAARYYTDIFGLDESKYCPIESKLYGYKGTLTLFDPPHRLDRIEITQTWGGGAMDRFWQKRGDSLYMCYIETDDVTAMEQRLQAANLRYAPGEGRPDGTNIFIHPQTLFGMLMGVSKTNYGWLWSGRPNLAGAGPGDAVH